MNIYYCKEGSEPVAIVSSEPEPVNCPDCNESMSVIGVMEYLDQDLQVRGVPEGSQGSGNVPDALREAED